jgi:hypothetical protein
MKVRKGNRREGYKETGSLRLKMKGGRDGGRVKNKV